MNTSSTASFPRKAIWAVWWAKFGQILQRKLGNSPWCQAIRHQLRLHPSQRSTTGFLLPGYLSLWYGRRLCGAMFFSTARAQRLCKLWLIWQLFLKDMSNSWRHKHYSSLSETGQIRHKSVSEVEGNKHQKIIGKIICWQQELTLKGW